MKMKPLLTSLVLTNLVSIFAAPATAADIGAGLFGTYCTACHGAAGLGDGDMANVVSIPSPNLTLLAKNNDGVFPMLKVLQIIDGRSGVRAHGGAMPLWGDVFSEQIADPEGEYGGVLEVRGRILSLATYLEIHTAVNLAPCGVSRAELSTQARHSQGAIPGLTGGGTHGNAKAPPSFRCLIFVHPLKAPQAAFTAHNR